MNNEKLNNLKLHLKNISKKYINEEYLISWYNQIDRSPYYEEDILLAISILDIARYNSDFAMSQALSRLYNYELPIEFKNLFTKDDVINYTKVLLITYLPLGKRFRKILSIQYLNYDKGISDRKVSRILKKAQEKENK